MSNFGNDSSVYDYDSDCEDGSDWDNPIVDSEDEHDDLWDPMPGQD